MDTSIEKSQKEMVDSYQVSEVPEMPVSPEACLKIIIGVVHKLSEENKYLKKVSEHLNCENSALKEKIKELESSNNTCAQFFEEVFGKLPQEFSVDDFKTSIDNHVKAAYKDGYGSAVSKMSICLQEMKYDSVVTIKQVSALQKAFVEDYGRYYFKVFGDATTKNRLVIIKALKDIYNVPLVEIKNYVSSLPVNGFGCTILLESVSESTCKKLKEVLEKVQIECGYYYI